MKLIYKLLLIPMLAIMACKKEPNEDAPKPSEPVADIPFYYDGNLRFDPTDIREDEDGNCIVIGGGFVYKLSPSGAVINTLMLIPGSWSKQYAFTPEGSFYSSILSTNQPRKEKLVIYEASSSQSFFFSPLVVHIAQTRLPNPNDEVWYWFGNSYPNPAASFADYGVLQFATKFIKNGITGKIDTTSVMLNITYPFGVTDTMEINLPNYNKRIINYSALVTDNYVLVNQEQTRFYRYDSKLKFIDSINVWPNFINGVANNQFLYQDNRGYVSTPNGTDNAVKIDLLEETDRIINIDDAVIYVWNNSGEIYSVDLKANTRTFIIDSEDKRFNTPPGVYDVWKSKKGKYFLFTTRGLYII
jgi:hypothetical protein